MNQRLVLRNITSSPRGRTIDELAPGRPRISLLATKPGTRPAAGSALRLFDSYSHKDEDLQKQLEVHLKLLERKGVNALWHDRLIGAGQEMEGADLRPSGAGRHHFVGRDA